MRARPAEPRSVIELKTGREEPRRSSCMVAFAEHGGRLTIDVYAPAGEVEVRVADGVTVMRQGRRVA